VIEDASHAIGGRYKGKAIGNCEFSDITVFSFHPVKIITTAEGGMITTNSNSLANKMQLLRSHGITRNESEMTKKPDGPWYYQQIDLGFNYRMTDIQAALGLSQMSRLDEFVSKRHEIANRYYELLSETNLTLPWQHPDSYSGLHLFVIRVPKKNQKSHITIFNELREAGIGVNLHYIPVYLQPYYENLGFKLGHCPNAEDYYAEAISIPMYSALSEDQLQITVGMIKKLHVIKA
jgi:dTDP-4-amino-4,6-dideoxygalactose transaminase